MKNTMFIITLSLLFSSCTKSKSEPPAYTCSCLITSNNGTDKSTENYIYHSSLTVAEDSCSVKQFELSVIYAPSGSVGVSVVCGVQ